MREKSCIEITRKSVENRATNSSEIEFEEIIEPVNIVPDNFEYNVEHLQEKKLEIVNKLSLVDAVIQVTSGDLINPNFSSFITTDKELSTATGIPNLEMLDAFIKIIERVAPTFSYYSEKLTIRDRIILTFMRLKQNVSYAFLNILFKNCSERHISNVISNTLDILSKTLKFAVFFPVKGEILRNVPFCFQDYADVSLILDCTEIDIQKPKNLCCQLMTYSFYKSRYIFKQRGIIDFLGKDEKIMMDKGFLIDDICIQNGIQIVRPPFLEKNTVFSKRSVKYC